MTLAIPTASSIKTLFTEFSAVPDAKVEFVIEEARVAFGNGTNWTAGADIALIYLVAHYLFCGMVAASTTATGGESISSESIGRLSISYAQNSTGGNAANPERDDLSTSSYGLRYQQLVCSNFSGAQII